MLKRFALLAVLAITFALAACSSGPGATVNFGDKENPARVTGVTGLESHDVANVVNYGAYTNAKATAPQKEVCSIKAIKGQTISMSGVESITCYAPETDNLAGPTQAKSTFERNTAAVGNLIEKATPLGLGGMALADRNNARASAERINESNNELEAAENASQASQTGQLVEALKEKPQIVFAQPL